MRQTLVVIAVVLTLTTPMFASGLEELIVTTTLSGLPMLGIEVLWAMDQHSHIRAGMPLGFEGLLEGTLMPSIWGRASYLYNINPSDNFSLYGGLGWNGALAFAPEDLAQTSFFELPVGFQFDFGNDFEVLGEVRMALADPGSISKDASYINISGGVVYSLR